MDRVTLSFGPSLTLNVHLMLYVRSHDQVWLRTEDYLKDALGSVVSDIKDMAIDLLTFVDAQVRLARCRATIIEERSWFAYSPKS